MAAMNKILTSTALSLVAFGASAADLPRRSAAPVPAPVFVAAPSWGGFYVGANAGYAKSDFDVSRSYSSNALGANFVTQALNGGYLPTGFKTDDGSFTAGVGIGYNFQAGNFVFGLEADINYLGAEASGGFISAPTPEVQIRPTPGAVGTTADDIVTIGSAARASVDWLGTVRGRLGYSFDRILVYGTGGLAFGQVKASGGQIVSFDCQADCGTANDVAAAWAGSGSKTKFGWTAGAGVEFQLTSNLSMKAEYLHYDLGSVSYDLTSSDVLATELTTLGGLGARDRVKASGDMVRAGLNYRFGGASSAPVIARY